jgi:hypothetical protein
MIAPSELVSAPGRNAPYTLSPWHLCWRGLVSVLLAIEGKVDHEADEHVPKMGKLGVGPGEQAPERPEHDGADGRTHRGDPACA